MWFFFFSFSAFLSDSLRIRNWFSAEKFEGRHSYAFAPFYELHRSALRNARGEIHHSRNYPPLQAESGNEAWANQELALRPVNGINLQSQRRQWFRRLNLPYNYLDELWMGKTSEKKTSSEKLRSHCIKIFIQASKLNGELFYGTWKIVFLFHENIFILKFLHPPRRTTASAMRWWKPFYLCTEGIFRLSGGEREECHKFVE